MTTMTTNTSHNLTSGSDAYRGTDLYIHTLNGRFYLARPTWDVEAMAHSLSQIPRFGGNATRFYSVAEHCLLVSALVEELGLGDPLEGQFHDGTESVLIDIPSPIKSALPDYKALEHKLDISLRLQFNLPPTITDGVKRADWLALFLEAEQLLNERGQDFVDPHGIRVEAMRLRNKGWKIRGMEWRDAKQAFLDRYDYLIHERATLA